MKILQTALILLATLSCIAQNKYPYPMDIPVSLSASYAELRANHFHSGLDMSTKGVVGVGVKSVADGYVSRIKISPYGYGHALYITHDDGNTTVYGHLQGYCDKIEDVVRREQYKHKSFEIDVMLKKGEISVKRGEIVAFSGNTGGSGGPHLHFEVRDTKTEEPLNPLAYLEAIPDALAPTIYGIKLYGQNDSAQIAGRCSDRYYSLKEIEGQTIDVFGEIGAGVHAVDYFVQGGRPCGVSEIKLYDGETLVFHSLIDRFSFDDTRFINSHIDYAERAKNQRFVQKSFTDPNNKLKIYRAEKSVRVRENEIHNMRYELMDFNGNRRSVKFAVRGKRNPQALKRRHKGEKAEWAKTWAKDTLGISVVISRESLYKDEWIEIEGINLNNDVSIYQIGTDQIGLQKAISITLPIADVQKKNADRLFLGKVNEKGVLSFVDKGVISGDMLTGKSKTFGQFTIGVDTIAPKIWTKNTRTRLTQQNNIMIGISDNLSGIRKYNCYIDGQWVCMEYDYKQTRLWNKVSKLNLKTGDHVIEAVIEDECGNESRWTWNFTIVD
ncbi:MAG: M23 family metallopeptidase [Bacteroidales bacterium]|nr:M23 family metallopeptidase [Bacteroidales bacterium]